MPRTTTVRTFSIPDELDGLLKRRVDSLRMSRSQYILQLIRRDLAISGSLNVSPEEPKLRVAEDPPDYGQKKKAT